ncbi:late histone H2A.2.2 [Nematolebias whitei]|uniref:late histone H2A.2.2-like n=1 Tax=Nematolebias whitei TaxID=451745 RepID=UPI001897D07F|nr:late histone H2A.2.2-like [Nematolebias whitei]XP_037534121.1 late histone H2A.2.2 [Nematolebias whitei]
MSGREKRSARKPKPARSQSARAELTFPVSRVHRLFRRGRYAKRTGPGAAVYLAAVLEYLCAELLEMAGKASKANKKRRITPRHILLAVKNDDEFSQLLAAVTIAEGGVLPNSQSSLLPKAKVSRKGGSS